MTLLPRSPSEWSETAVWQDVEFGSYTADLPLWDELAAEADGPILELGAGAGRVALHLAHGGSEVIAVERDLELGAELERRCEGLPVEVVTADLATASLPRVPLAIGPLQLIQLLGDSERRALLETLAGALAPGGRAAFAIVDESTLVERAGAAQAKPDMREVGDWVYSSEALWVMVGDEVLRMRRLRERVAPGGDFTRRFHEDVMRRLPPEVLEDEARAVGLEPAGRREVASSEYEAGSIVVILEAR